MKYVYVLISDAQDYYSEQAFLSMSSLKRHNKDTYIVLITDKETGKYLKVSRNHLLKPLNELIEVDIPKEFNKKCRSRYLKTSLREFITGDFLYIDSDTVINGNLSLLSTQNCDIAAAFDCNGKGEGSSYMISNFLKIGEKNLDDYIFFNGGILFVRDTPRSHKFFKDWKTIWWNLYKTYGIEIDQVSFLKANVKNENLIKELPGEFNCQLPFPNSIDYLINAKIIHYISDYKSLSEFPFENIKLLNKVREEGETKEIEDIIANPIVNYLKYNLLLGKNEESLYRSPLVVLARKLSRDFNWTNKLILSIYRLFG